jgi:hypothetical protein
MDRRAAALYASRIVTVESVRLRLLLVAPLRLVLGACWLAAARAAGATATAALLAFAAGAFATAFLASNDPRARFRAATRLHELPDGARVAPAWLHAFHAAFPSTVGVSAIASITLLVQPTLVAGLGGVLAGLGGAAVLAASQVDRRLYVDPRRGTLFLE